MGKMKLSICNFFLFACTSITVEAQPTATFSAFHGTVYDIPPGDYLQKGYGDYVAYFDIMGHTTLASLNVPKSFVYDKYFPGVALREFFGIIFLSSLTISQKGCFEFYLESDDGSKLWIGDSLVIDNDGMHKMTIKRDTMYLGQGTYDAKVWYYSALPSQFGLILKSRALPDSVQCGHEKSIGLKRQLTLDMNNVLFDLNSSVISGSGMAALDALCDEVNQSEISKIQVIGYTDNTGTAVYNEELSLRRAQAIAGYIKTKLRNPDVIIEAEGRGSSNPVAPGETASAKTLNRRVEIFIE